MKKRFFTLCAVILCLLLLQMPIAAQPPCLTAINDNLLPLTAGAMPAFSAGQLYAPYTVFDRSHTGVDLGIYCTFNAGTATVSMYASTKKFLQFNIKAGTAQDGVTGEVYTAPAFVRGGVAYVPVNLVCRYFSLSSSYLSIDQGNLLRIKNNTAVLSDHLFIDAASNLIATRLKEYQQSLNPAPAPSSPSAPTLAPTPVPPSGESQTAPVQTQAYLGFLCTDTAAVQDILSALGQGEKYAVFFFPPELIAQQGDLTRQILGTGHSIGILAQGDTPEQTQALVQVGNENLHRAAMTKTLLVHAPSAQHAALTQQGFICWRETAIAAPKAEKEATYIKKLLSRLPKNRQSVYLTLTADAPTQRLLPALLRALQENYFIVCIPTELSL